MSPISQTVSAAGNLVLSKTLSWNLRRSLCDREGEEIGRISDIIGEGRENEGRGGMGRISEVAPFYI